MRPLNILRAAKAAVRETMFGLAARAHALPLQHGPHQAAIGPGVAYLDVSDELLAARTRHLHASEGRRSARALQRLCESDDAYRGASVLRCRS